MKLLDHILYSKTTKIVILLVICLSIGFIAPAIINIFLDFTPPSPYVAGTCHIKVGMRANCFPDVDAKNQVHIKESKLIITQRNFFTVYFLENKHDKKPRLILISACST